MANKPAKIEINDQVKIIEQTQRKAYLRSKGLDPNGQFQLDLIFPGTIGDREDLRHIPNDYARSSIFTTRNKTEPRRSIVHEKLFHYNETVTILFTGIELRAEDDELVWLQILNYAQKVQLGDPFSFSVKNLVSQIGWSKNGRNYDRARECISRLKANEILALNSKAYGNSASISLIQNYSAVNDSKGKATEYKVSIHKNLMLLFAGNTFTSHKWESYRKLPPVARRLADYIDSHQDPYALALEKFQRMCGSTDTTERSWRQTVKKACEFVKAAKIASTVFVSKDDRIVVVRK